MILLLQVGHFPYCQRLEMISNWTWMVIREWSLKGSLLNFMWLQIQTPRLPMTIYWYIQVRIGHFQNKTGVYGLHPGRFLLPDALNRNSYMRHEPYSLPYTSVFGFVTCCVTSKRLGVRSVEGHGQMWRK